MKAIFTGLILTILGVVSGISQELTVKHGEQIVNNDTIYLTGTLSTELIEVGLSVTNNRNVAVSLKIRKTEVFIVDGTEASFCWGECYTPAVMVSPMAIAIQPGATDTKSFLGDYRPFGIGGTSIVRFSFFDASDPSRETSVTVFFQVGGSGIEPATRNPLTITAYPNPANQFIRIGFSEDYGNCWMATLMNLEGQSMKSMTVAPGTRETVLRLDEYPAGLYLIRLTDDQGHRYNKKICITH